jgi:hypothetical protein
VVYKIEISVLAEEEYFSAYHFYENQSSGLELKFEKETDTILDKLKLNPFIFQCKFKLYREAIYKKFPYYIVYEIIDDSVVVLSIFHSFRNPDRKLKSRI